MTTHNDWCRHYRGMAGRYNRETEQFDEVRCEAGMASKSMGAPGDSGSAKPLEMLYPCFERDKVPYLCPHTSYFTKEEKAAKEAEIAAFLNEWASRLERGVCTTCEQPMTQKQVGRCVYAEPCGHRLFQGRVTRKAGALTP